MIRGKGQNNFSQIFDYKVIFSLLWVASNFTTTAQRLQVDSQINDSLTPWIPSFSLVPLFFDNFVLLFV